MRNQKPSGREFERATADLSVAGDESFQDAAREEIGRLGQRAERLGVHLQTHQTDERARGALGRVIDSARRIAAENGISPSGDPR